MESASAVQNRPRNPPASRNMSTARKNFATKASTGRKRKPNS